MKDTPSTHAQQTLPLPLAFEALKILTDQHFITGTDVWRHATGGDSLSTFDPELAAVVQKQPPSKFGHAGALSLWTATHFCLALPMLSYAIRKYGTEDETTAVRTLSNAEIEKYFIAFPHIIRHYREYRELAAQFGKPDKLFWDNTLRGAFGNISEDTTAMNILKALPPYLRDTAQQVLSGGSDSLSGRIILAYLFHAGVSVDELPFDKRARQYLAPMHGSAPVQTLYERLIAAQTELSQLDPYLSEYNEARGLVLNQFLELVSWYARPHLVEMMVPGLTGAAEPAIRALLTLFADITQGGGPDYTVAAVKDLPSVQKFYATQSLEAIGRLSVVKDMLANVPAAITSDGEILRRLAGHLYSDSERQTAWSNAVYYVPDARRKAGFPVFRQDVANIIYCAGLFTEVTDDTNTLSPKKLKKLAGQLSTAQSSGQMRAMFQDERDLLDDVTADWERHYQGQEKLRLLHFVRQTFGLDMTRPIPIPLDEINKGFAQSHYDGRTYHLHYQEADKVLEMAIGLPPPAEPPASVRYQTIADSQPPRTAASGLPYSAWLEVSRKGEEWPIIIPVPGRGSFDPFGRQGSPHAGEVVGFGCSVHHASLAVLLAELASLGAGQAELEHVTAGFMGINREMHERRDLASFQLAQTIAAFRDGVSYDHSNYLASHPGMVPDETRPHLAAYARSGKKSLAWAEPQAARLAFGYPTLYPLQGKVRVDPRHSWYDGRAVELPEAAASWQVLTC